MEYQIREKIIVKEVITKESSSSEFSDKRVFKDTNSKILMSNQTKTEESGSIIYSMN